MDNHYRIRSNRESGDGRYDIRLIPREHKYPEIIMELKWKEGLDENAPDILSKDAPDQMDDRRYDSEMREEGVGKIIKPGIAFSGKSKNKVTVQQVHPRGVCCE